MTWIFRILLAQLLKKIGDINDSIVTDTEVMRTSNIEGHARGVNYCPVKIKPLVKASDKSELYMLSRERSSGSIK